jgi:hypothetical protein
VIEGPATLPPAVRVAVMPGDPRECRERALRCAQLAVTARPQQLKDALQPRMTAQLPPNSSLSRPSPEQVHDLGNDGGVNFRITVDQHMGLVAFNPRNPSLESIRG